MESGEIKQNKLKAVGKTRICPDLRLKIWISILAAAASATIAINTQI